VFYSSIAFGRKQNKTYFVQKLQGNIETKTKQNKTNFRVKVKKQQIVFDTKKAKR
jgi:hypothetical protein